MPAFSTARRSPAPAYRLHKPSGRAVVSVAGRDVYLGAYGSDESRAQYDRVVGEWLLAGRRSAPSTDSATVGGASVNELLLAYLDYADGYYRKNGRPTGEYDAIRVSLRPLKRLYGMTVTGDFGPLALKTVRQAMIDDGLCRSEVNKRVSRVVRVFKWGVEQELVPPMVHHALAQVAGLKKGRTSVRESEPVRPVEAPRVDAIRPFVSRHGGSFGLPSIPE